MIGTNTIVGGRYRVVRRIGGGGMKQVYLAEDTRLANRPCALAEMIDSLADPAEQQAAAASFQREADMLAGLEHENIVRIYDRLSEGSRHYLVMEYVEGETLEQKLESAANKKLDERGVTEAAVQVLGALEYLHGQSPPVVYRDLKPANVMVRANGRIKLIDFGIARLFIPKKTATMVGTQGYAPPEQYEGKAEPRSDLYALGVTMFHLLTGWDPALHPPFMFPQIQSLRPDLNPELAALIGEAMALEASRRIASAAEFRRRLENLASATEHLSLQMRSAVVQPPMGRDAPTVKGLAAFVCPSCVEPVPADAKFCPYCSADLSTAPQASKRPHRRRRSAWLAGSLAVLLAVGFAAMYCYVQTQRAAIHRLYGEYVQCYGQYKGGEACKSELLISAAPDRIQRTAAAGDAEARFLLGSMYNHGIGVSKDYEEALRWFLKAAVQGNAYGEFDVGYMYYHGEGVPKDYGEALKWFRRAAVQGDAYAENDMGVMYEEGEGVPKDYGEALKWFRKAAEQGDADGETSLGVMYDNGEGVQIDHGEALRWFLKAAVQGNAVAEFDLGVTYENGDIPKDYGEALRWYLKSAEQGNADAEVNLGIMYYNGEEIPKDYSEALRWFRKAVEQGDAEGETWLGLMYHNGEGVPKDYGEALRWTRKAAEQGYVNAEYDVGLAYLNGEGVPKDYGEALRWLNKAAADGSEDARRYLEKLYDEP